MNIRFAIGQKEANALDTQGLRDRFLVDGLFQNDRMSLVYSHHDRMIVGGCQPIKKKIALEPPAELRAAYFLERRELGIINIGGKAEVEADGKKYSLNKLECLYLGKGVKKVVFASADSKKPAKLYVLSAPAHHSYPAVKYTRQKAAPVHLGDASTSNKRTVYKYIHREGIQSCQLVMGLTVLEKGSVWNSVPPHTHTRRMEVYLYFDLGAAHRVFHFMGEPQETRHIVMANDEAVISPPWSMHFGCGTSNYSFVWGMAGENLDYTDMDPALISTLK
ncbi:MAG: 5-dehydro-4-deoxy-D-glucuronate isomerase [Bacteroidetes bacterium]|nr:5-dehydro-4-deoxy-D-glucuronate isomerase [Bacteroidota bacterium]